MTSRTIAKMSGVSQTTVSRVLSGHPNVKPATREKVLQVLKETGYAPNAAASAMRKQSAGVLGVVTGYVTNPFYPELAEALHLEITKQGKQMSFWLSDGGMTDGGELAALDAVRRRAVDGVIYTTVTSNSRSLRAALVPDGPPILLLNRTLPDVHVDSVASQNELGARSVARYFVENDRLRIACVAGEQDASTTSERESGFRNELESRGFPLSEESVFRGDYTHETGYQALEYFLSGAGDAPTAIFCVNDVMAFGLLDAARIRGIRVPEDLWVVGYDDVQMASWASFDLTTVRQPVEQMARVAVRMLIDRIEGRSPASHQDVRLTGEVIVRNSTGGVAV